MLQRIQTLFLLLAAAAMLIASVTPLAIFLHEGENVVFEAMGVYQNGELNSSTWGLFLLTVVSSVLALFTVFLYKQRMLQIRLSIFNLVCMVGFYLYFGFILYKLYPVENLLFEKVGVGVIMPVIAIILTILAIRKIGADEALVRSLNRLRG
jgi:MFS-type transporter involved in bile tolerance (Atg22 family)